MKYLNVGAVPLKDVLWPAEVGEQVVCHVLADAREPQPDFKAMQRLIAEPSATKPVPEVAEAE
ncbi:MAG TPA: hypothetical protein VGR92_03545 [Steroidobacteraceae bacterium]|nr:hypothetical protein [Steroidobacteraceae bacterium]